MNAMGLGLSLSLVSMTEKRRMVMNERGYNDHRGVGVGFTWAASK